MTRKFSPTLGAIPSVGRIVHYRLGALDAAQIMGRRTTGAHIDIGNTVKTGDTFPMLIVKAWGDTPESAVNGQVFLDGNDVFWATSVQVGDGPRTWSWPARV